MLKQVKNTLVDIQMSLNLWVGKIEGTITEIHNLGEISSDPPERLEFDDKNPAIDWNHELIKKIESGYPKPEEE